MFGFNIVPWAEKTNGEKTNIGYNEIASKIIGTEIYGRVFLAIVCPNTNKKFWNFTKKTINNILSIIDNEEIKNKIQKEIEQAEININPYYFIKKYIV